MDRASKSGTPNGLDKFRKVCGLLTSEHDGERATAARMATDILKQRGLTWADVSLASSSGSNARDLQSQIRILQQLLEDERRRTTRLTEQLNSLKGIGAPSKPTASRERPINSDTAAVGELRGLIYEALERDLSERTREFLESVVQRQTWTIKQLEAIRRTLKWALKD